MAQRPVFIPSKVRPWVRREMIEFTWHSGFAPSQKQKSIASLHSAARSELQIAKILEISSKSLDSSGIAASAFNLKLQLPDGTLTTVESAYQGSKRFSSGGPYTDIYSRSSPEAKRDERVHRTSDRLLAFQFFSEDWPLEPRSLFYDWLYLSAMTQPQNKALLVEVITYRAFTDIEFNPEKSVSCQANSAALLLGLKQSGHDLPTITNAKGFRALSSGPDGLSQAGQTRLF